jgi:2-keto-4-pentenoate hydratase/2-oxohepta-3-ene-1,7-dioic acid hydratase in catechol pathway
MKLITYVEDSVNRLGILTDAGVIAAPLSPDAFYHGGSKMLAELAQYGTGPSAAIEMATLQLAPLVPNPGKILCVGLNYAKHAAESGMALPEYPVLFSKFNNVLAADGEAVPMAADWEQVDYESELAVVIGKTVKNVSEADALDAVLGYCCANDISERALQFRSGQWLLGKTPDKFLPLGPYLLTADEVPDPQALAIKGWFNGELRQNSSTADMIFSVAQIISYASQFMTLNPGDVISTGTPEGVIIGMEHKVFMQPGDEYVVEIETLGRLTNRIISA